MVTAYVMVKAHTGDADRLREELEGIEGVIEAHIVAGDVDLIAKVDVGTPAEVKDVDLIAKVDVGTPAEVKDVAATQVQDIEGVEGTQTYIAMD